MSDKPRPLCVKELIDLLQKFKPGDLVFLEGCDCSGPAKGVEQRDPGEIEITREMDW